MSDRTLLLLQGGVLEGRAGGDGGGGGAGGAEAGLRGGAGEEGGGAGDRGCGVEVGWGGGEGGEGAEVWVRAVGSLGGGVSRLRLWGEQGNNLRP